MLACFLEVTRKVAVRDVPVPKLAPGDILARMEASGICGTDLEKENCLIDGPGTTGLTQIQLLRNITTGRIIGSDIVDARLKLGKKLGAHETVNPLTEDVPAQVKKISTEGVDLAVVSTGNEK